MNEPSGKIITFYSYKGGTGRSMALANVAWILASNGKRVLVVDWDLEAPGLHRYFAPFLTDPDQGWSDGVIDFLNDYADVALTPPPAGEEHDETWYRAYADMARLATSLEWSFPAPGGIDFIGAGRQGPAYASRAAGFPWQAFYDRLGGGPLLDEVRERLRASYDYVLIDSRTGVSDTAGICTIQMPDILVVCFTLNHQSINGAATVAQVVSDKPGKQDMPILPVPMRVDPFETDKLERGRKRARQAFALFPNHLAPEEREQYWNTVEVPYRTFYAYEEVLAAFGDEPGRVGTILAAMEQITARITRGEVVLLPPIPDSLRLQVRDRFAGSTMTGEVESQAAGAGERALAELTGDALPIARRTLLRLVRVAGPEEADGDGRVRVPIAELGNEEQVNDVVRVLTRAGVVTIRPDTALHTETVELTDDALLTMWPRLTDWLAEDREFLLWRQQLRAKKAEWERSGFDDGALLAGRPLDEALQWLASRREDLNAAECEFIVTSSLAAGAEQAASPRFDRVTISSTFTDLREHRAALDKALREQVLIGLGLELVPASPNVDVVDASLRMVRDGAAYVGIIGHKYGQIPSSAKRNPEGLSITELEFNEAVRLGRPTLLFVMGEDHPVRRADVEQDPARQSKLGRFRQRAKEPATGTRAYRVYVAFDSLDEFRAKTGRAVAELRRHLDDRAKSVSEKAAGTSLNDPASLEAIPTPPAFYAQPPFIASHAFVGRQAELEMLSDWASAANPNPILLFEAMGGTGKSILTWEWTTRHAPNARADWAGRFWYSFYERGAVMADFCRRALAYTTGHPLSAFRRMKTPELGELLVRQFQERPWLFVLDGLERVLVAYHRFDAAQAGDEEADTIIRRDLRSATRPEDDDLLRTLAAIAPSKLLLTTRLTPLAMLNQTGQQPIPGVLRTTLPGLRPADAEDLVRQTGVHGASETIQRYLKTHFDFHPLVTGVVAGLINDYLPDRGNFDAWAADPEAGGRLDLAQLDLVQKRNHILYAALGTLTDVERRLLAMLALLSEAVDYATLCGLHPPGQRTSTPQEMAAAIHSLERRGLLQYDPLARRYDLHPVVRGVVAGSLAQDEKAR